jgi:hypothetical protein
LLLAGRHCRRQKRIAGSASLSTDIDNNTSFAHGLLSLALSNIAPQIAPSEGNVSVRLAGNGHHDGKLTTSLMLGGNLGRSEFGKPGNMEND